MKKLIIAEKPSLQRTIMRALETEGEHFNISSDNEYSESEHYVATAQFGHLLELKMPEEYPGEDGRKEWSIDKLPFFPEKYLYNVRKDSKTRYLTIGKLLKRKDIDTVIHCGDPDREGQILIDLVLRQHGNTKRVMRPELKALTDEAIIEALRTAKSNEEYKNVFNEGMTRMCFDWDFGINLSQYATMKTSARPALNVGRVIGAICSEIYDKDISIENFVPEDYFKVVSDIEGGFKLTSKEKFDKDKMADAEAYAALLQSEASIVSDIEEKQLEKKRPKLFSQTSLQAAMSKKFDYTPDETLQVAQSLYEKGYTSYPRTNTEYIAEDEKDSIRQIVDAINTKGLLEFRDVKAIFDNSKIEGHSAITITGKKPSSLTEDEKNCYMLILNRFKAVFCKEPCLYNKTTVHIHNPHEDFKVSGEVLVQKGWQEFEPPQKKTKEDTDNDDDKDISTLPKVSVGEVIETDFKAVSAKTKPPAHYTVETLGKWMENPFRKEDSTDEEDYKNILSGLQIGTEATRAGILKKAEEKKYISLKKKAYKIEPRGRFLIESCRKLGIDFSKEMTAGMGRALKSVGRGEMGIKDILYKNRIEVTRIINEDLATIKDSKKYGGEDEYVAKEKVSSSIYIPTGEEISFNKEWGGHKFTDEEIELLLQGETIEFEGKSQKAGKPFTAKGSLKKQKYKGKEFWGFAMSDEIPDEWGKHVFTEEEKELLRSGEILKDVKLWSSKKIKWYTADLVYKKGKLTPVFEKK